MFVSIAFLTFAIFYDEIIDDDNENAEEYWDRIQKEIKSMQNASRIERFNKTMQNATQAGEAGYVSIIAANATEPVIPKPSITFEDFIQSSFTPKAFNAKWISSNELLHYDSLNNLCITNVSNLNTTIIIPFETIVSIFCSNFFLN